jgi:hypothetical protein
MVGSSRSINEMRSLALRLTGSDEQEFVRALVQDVRVVEVGVFGDDDALFSDRDGIDRFVRGPIVRWKVTGVDGVVPSLGQNEAESAWQMGVNQEFHASTRCWLLT